MEAGLKTLELLERPGIYKELEEKANVITKPVQAYLEKNEINATIQQVGSMFTLFFGRRKVTNMEEAKGCNLEEFARFFRYTFSRNVYIPPMQVEAWFVSTAHTQQHLEATRDIIIDFFKAN